MPHAKPISENQLYKRPHHKVAIADYPIVDMHEVYVARDDWDEVADLLMAHPSNPLKLKGIVFEKGQHYELTFEIMTGFSVEDGDQGLDGDCKLFALGNCRWYKICSPGIGFEDMLTAMRLESRIYWILRDKRGDWFNSVDQEMADRYPAVDEAVDYDIYQDLIHEVGQEYEAIDERNYYDYFRAVDFYLNKRSDPSEAKWQIGLAAATPYIPYLLHHMLVDKDLLWEDSFFFAELGRINTKARNELYMRHGREIPLAKTRSRNREVEPDCPANTLPIVKAEPREAKLEAQVEAARPTSKRKRLSSDSVDAAIPQKAKAIERSSASEMQPKSKKAKRTRSTEPDIVALETASAQPQRNVKATSRRVYSWAHKAPFAQVTGRNQRQVSVLVKVLMLMLYDEEVSDLNLHDLVYVLKRDWNVDQEKACALVYCYAGSLLQELSRTDRRDPSQRPELTATENPNADNVWRSTTLYDQLFKIYKILDQDSNLLSEIDLSSQHIFHRLECDQGIWKVRKSEQSNGTFLTPKSKTVPSDIGLDHLDSDNTSGEHDKPQGGHDHHRAASKGRSSLRPAAKTGAPSYIRNGAGPKPAKSMTPTKLTKQLSSTFSEDSRSSRASSITGLQTDSGSPTKATPSLSGFARNNNNIIAKPAPKILRPPQFKMVKHLETAGNNANIWRCPIDRCYYFQDSCSTEESQRLIVQHYDEHADEMFERISMIDEASAKTGISTTALTRKLAKEAELWRELMKQ